MRVIIVITGELADAARLMRADYTQFSARKIFSDRSIISKAKPGSSVKDAVERHGRQICCFSSSTYLYIIKHILIDVSTY